MKNIIKFFRSVANAGFFNSMLKVIQYIKGSIMWSRILRINNLEDRFTEIYNSNAWNDDESVSGTGSSFKATKLLRSQLPNVFKELEIESILDAPCGDFRWIKSIIESSNISYVGADIVQDIVDSNNNEYSCKNINFLKLDITADYLPKADLMFCRDCLFHLSFIDIHKTLQNFVSSETKYLMTTTHINSGKFENLDISSGDYRKIDLFSAPFGFPIDTVYEVDDWLAPEPPRKMYVWSRDQIKNVLEISNFSD